MELLELPAFFEGKSRGSSSSSSKETNDTKRLKEDIESDNLVDIDSSLSKREEDEASTASNSQTMPSNNDKVDEILLKLKQLDISVGKKYGDANKPRAIIARCLRFKDRKTLFALRRC